VKDYYKILGVPRSAGPGQIKEAFKRLAVRYHPDKNPGDKASEEIFKEISLAYDILRDPEKKARFDLLIHYSESTSSYTTSQPPQPDFRYRRPHPPPGRYRYQFEKNYLRNQLLAFGFVFCVAILVLSVQAAYEYKLRKDREREENYRNLRIEAAVINFHKGNYNLAFDSLQYLIKEYPGEFSLKEKKNALLDEVKQSAERNFSSRNFETSAQLFKIARDYEEPYLLNLDVHFKLAQSYENLKEYELAAAAINYVLARDSENINLNLQLANLYNDRLDEPEKALEYYNIARQKIRDILISAYGRAYELVVNPKKLPELYYHVYKGRGIANAKLGNYSESIKDFNWAIFFRPVNGEDYYFRAQDYYNLKDINKGCKDIARAVELGYEPAIDVQKANCR